MGGDRSRSSGDLERDRDLLPSDDDEDDDLELAGDFNFSLDL